VTDTTVAAGTSAALSAMKLPQLQALASELGVAGVTKMKKSALVDAINNGGAAPAAPAVQAAPARSTSRTSRSARSAQTTIEESPSVAAEQSAKSAPAASAPSHEAEESAAERARRAKEAVAIATTGDANGDRAPQGDRSQGGRTSGRTSGRNSQRQRADSNRSDSGDDSGEGDQQRQQSQSQSQQQPQQQRGDDEDRNGRRRRGRGRGRTTGTTGRLDGRPSVGMESLDEDDVRDDDELTPVGGIIDVLDNYAFIRTTGYLPGKSDVYVSMNQVRKYGLRKGDAVSGAARLPRPGERGQRQKFSALAHIDKVNGMDPERARNGPSSETSRRFTRRRVCTSRPTLATSPTA